MLEMTLFDNVDLLCRTMVPQKKDIPFASKVVIISGDWKQSLPVVIPLHQKPKWLFLYKVHTFIKCFLRPDLFKICVSCLMKLNSKNGFINLEPISPAKNCNPQIYDCRIP